jgi:hypothetical protein
LLAGTASQATIPASGTNQHALNEIANQVESLSIPDSQAQQEMQTESESMSLACGDPAPGLKRKSTAATRALKKAKISVAPAIDLQD